MAKILIVEDDDSIRSLLEDTLVDEGHVCDTAADGEQGADLVEANHYDLALLDIMLPKFDGYDLMEYISTTDTPVIFLTAKTSVDDRVKGLEMGADDYIVKPFNERELIARIEMVLRRSGRGCRELQAFGVALDPQAKKVTKHGTVVQLAPKEFAVLEILMRHRGIALYRDTLFELAWEDEPQDNTRALDLTIMRLRRKLGWVEEIRAVKKIGYMLEKEE